MSIGFEAIDRKFRPKEPIKLECVECTSTTDVKTRPDIEGEPVLCAPCHHFKRPECY